MKLFAKITIYIALISIFPNLNSMDNDDARAIAMEEGKPSTNSPRQNVNSKCFCSMTEDEIIRDLNCERTCGREGTQIRYGYSIIAGTLICYGLSYAIIKSIASSM